MIYLTCSFSILCHCLDKLFDKHGVLLLASQICCKKTYTVLYVKFVYVNVTPVMELMCINGRTADRILSCNHVI